jgi:tetratricopeptide (TPR) repeat protein
VTARLEPLPDDAVGELVDLAPVALRDRIAAAAGGNPLFLTQMIAMADEDAEADVPPTLRALLAARLDQLEPSDRFVLERGAVEGEVFHRGAVQALTGGEAPITPRLAALVRRQLVRPDRPHVPGEDAFRFRHLLIRDAAYDALPKAVRADLHEQFADWLGLRGRDLVELDELLGHHLEQAARYRAELGQPDPALALRAGDRLFDAARRQLRPGNELPARHLLERALDVTRALRLDVHAELDLATTYHVEDPERAAAICRAAAERARAEGDTLAEDLARVGAALHRLFLDREPDVDGLEGLARSALPRLEEAGDHAGMVHVWQALGYGVANARGRMEDWAYAAEQSIRHARAAGWRTLDTFGLASALIFGPRPADEALETLDELVHDPSEPSDLIKRAYLLAILDRARAARELTDRAAERLREWGVRRHEVFFADIAALMGDYDLAVRNGEQAVADFEAHGHVFLQASYGAKLARRLCLLGRYDEAEELARFSSTIPSQETWTWRQALARVHAHRREHDDAERLAREAVAAVDETDQLTFQGDALWDLSDVLAAAARTAEAVEALEQAIARYERKRNLAMLAQVQPRLDALRAQAAA